MKLYDLIRQNRDLFSNEFVEWLPSNIHVYQAFVIEAIKIYEKGFKHYSSKTIIHVLRHHSAVREFGSEWKINNNFSPYLARLFDLAYPNMSGMFEYRKTFKADAESLARDEYETE